MEIAYTAVNTSYCCKELGFALSNAIPLVKQVVQEYAQHEDRRTLVIVLACPCCHDDNLLDRKDTVMVSPFRGIATKRHGKMLSIHCVEKYPPYSTGEGREAGTIEEYLDGFRATINAALGIKPVPDIAREFTDLIVAQRAQQ